jgi:very-short-patch-repair endonuclease
MVGGQVRPPRLDLANEDLIRSHVHALWLAETNLDLKSSLADLLDLDGDPPSLALRDSVQAAIQNDVARRRAGEKAQRMLASIPEIEGADWYSDNWLDETLRAAHLRFDDVCDRWRDLYLSAWNNRAYQHQLVGTASLTAADRGRAQALRDQAEAQIKLLTGESDESRAQSDCYSYRDFASEGFLPGYSFPRLPLSAWIPGRRGRSGRNDYLSRPRFLAISEFGPRSIVYHEGSRYRITQVLLPAERLEGNKLQTEQIKRCEVCGYLHPIQGTQPGPDLCEHCDAPLPNATERLFRLRNVVTKRQDRITSDEEERQRLGFEIWTAIRFATPEGVPSAREAEIKSGGATLAIATFAPSATIWRINVGWRRRGNPAKLGFVLDTNRGYWARSNEDPTDKDDAMSESRETVIPYVEDTRNVLILTPDRPLTPEAMASIGAALKTAIQTEFQLEDMELAVEALPSEHDRRSLLLYESAEGGAGILRRLAMEPIAMASVGRRALEICHFDPETGADQRRAPGAKDECAAACYDCLMSYGNQRDHKLLDRFVVKDWLMALATGHLETTSSYRPRDEHFDGLQRAAESTLEKAWLNAVNEGGYLLPTHAQHYLESAIARPDFLYEDKFVAIYVDGPVHDHRDVKERDAAAQSRLEDAGWYVLRFGPDSRSWRAILDANPGVFGKSS